MIPDLVFFEKHLEKTKNQISSRRHLHDYFLMHTVYETALTSKSVAHVSPPFLCFPLLFNFPFFCFPAKAFEW